MKFTNKPSRSPKSHLKFVLVLGAAAIVLVFGAGAFITVDSFGE